jgi:hypothetical protein
VDFNSIGGLVMLAIELGGSKKLGKMLKTNKEGQNHKVEKHTTARERHKFRLAVEDYLDKTQLNKMLGYDFDGEEEYAF